MTAQVPESDYILPW